MILLAMLFVLAAGNGATATELGRWRDVEPMPESRYFHAAAVGADGKVYAYGGYVRLADGARKYGRGEFSLVIYDPETDRWERGPAAPKYKQRSIKRHARGKIDKHGNRYDEWYIKDSIGGNRIVHELITGNSGPLGRPHWMSHYAWIWFDTESGTWTDPEILVTWIDNPEYDLYNPAGKVARIVSEGAPKFFRNVGTIATAPGGLAYLTGGVGVPINRRGFIRESATLDAAEVYDAKTSEWRLLTPMGTARSLHASAVDLQGRLFVFGGHQAMPSVGQEKGESDESFNRRSAANHGKANMSLSSVEMYDPKTNTWTERAPMPTPRQAMGAALGSDGRIYVIGGGKSYANPAPLSVVEIYDPMLNRWSQGPSLRYPRRSHQVVVTSNGRIYAIGGFVGQEKFSWLTLSGRGTDASKLGATVEVLDTKPRR